MFDSNLPVSYYKRIAFLSEEHGVAVMQHRETGRIFVGKKLSVYSSAVYESLFRHPVRNIPRIYAMCEEDGVLTVIEEYISGDTLEEVLSICGPFPEKEVIGILSALCDILNDLHTGDPVIVHRDIKPSNIIQTEDGRIVLIDLNAAREASSEKDRDTRLLGTKGFAAPEQFGFGSSTPRTDIYAMGVLAKTLLGREPDGRFGAVVRKCLEMNPKDRFSSAAALKSALAKIRI